MSTSSELDDAATAEVEAAQVTDDRGSQPLESSVKNAAFQAGAG